MAYYSAVPQVQQSIANTLRGGLAELGNRPLEQARFGLQKAQIEHELGRQAEQDAMAKTLFKQQQEEYNRIQKENNTPMVLSDFLQMTLGRPSIPGDAEYGPGGLMGSAKAPSKETTSHIIANNWLPEGFKTAGVHLGVDGTVLRADNTPVTWRDADKVGMIIASTVISKMDPGKAWNQKARKLGERDPESLSDSDKLWLKQYNEKKPERLIAAYQDQIQKIEGLRGPLAMINVKDFSVLDKGQERARDKIKALYDKMSADEKRKWDTDQRNMDRILNIELGMMREEGADRRSKIRAKSTKNTITLPGGKLLTLAEARGLFREYYQIPDEFELDQMEPSVARKYRDLAKEKNIATFIKRLQAEGLPDKWDENNQTKSTVPDWRMYQSRD